MLKAFFKDSAIYTVPTLLSRGMSLFLVPLYTQVLSPEDYGALDLLIVFMTIVNMTVALEISQGVARYYSMEKNSDEKVLYASTAFWFTTVCYFVFFIIAWGYSEELSRLVMAKDGMEDTFKIGLFYIVANGLFYLIQNQFRWELRSKQYAIMTLISTVAVASISVWLTYFLAWGLAGFLYGMLSGTVLGALYGLWWLRGTFALRFQSSKLKAMLKFSIPLLPSGIAVFISMYIDRIMINNFMTIADVGTYGIAFRIAGVAGLVMVGFQSALTPLVYNHYKETDTPEKLASIFRYFISGALLLFVTLTIFSQEILWLLTTSEYYSSAGLIIYMIPAILLANMYIFTPGIAIVGKTKYILAIHLFGAMINILLNWMFIPLIGLEGAAVATLIGNLLVFLSYLTFSQKLYPIPHKWMPIVSSVFLVSLLAILGREGLFEDIGVNMAAKFCLVTMSIYILFLSRLVSIDEVKKAYQFIRS